MPAIMPSRGKHVKGVDSGLVTENKSTEVQRLRELVALLTQQISHLRELLQKGTSKPSSPRGNYRHEQMSKTIAGLEQRRDTVRDELEAKTGSRH